MQIKINGKDIRAKEGSTILEAAKEAGIRIPALCSFKNVEPSVSCFVCVVRVEGKPHLIPSCAAKITEGMEITTDSTEVLEARKEALSLLLSDHNGDCLGPCQLTCPALIDIPAFIECIMNKDLKKGIEIIKEKVALPATLGRICPEICERACRRRLVDAPIAICHLKRYLADYDLKQLKSFKPERVKATGKKAAIIGAGPAGLTCAYFLARKGIASVIFDGNELPGGALRYAVKKERLSDDILDREIELIEDLGVKFKMKKKLGGDFSIKELLDDQYSAVFLALGNVETKFLLDEGIELSDGFVKADRKTLATNLKGVFAGGDCVNKTGLAVYSSASGRIAASSISQFLSGKPVIGEKRPFSSRMGKLSAEEVEIMMKEVSRLTRVLKSSVKPGKFNSGEKRKGFSDTEALKESARCMKCACKKRDDCRLLELSEKNDVQFLAHSDARRNFERDITHPLIVHETGKCVSCGNCVRICEEEKEKFGFAFIGRGFKVKVGKPLSVDLKTSLKNTAAKCEKNCPTGALALKRNPKKVASSE
jgi:ferredoxin